MKISILISYLSIIIFLIINVATGPGCANIIPPQGGPRDTIPPVLLKSDPGDSARNFKGRTITFTFDEFVDVQNVQENMLVSPLPKITPIIDYKLKIVTLKIKDTLEANTTYHFDFGDAVKDYTEGNPIKDFTYTFSTGRYLDSLSLQGKVILAETGAVDSTLIVILHTSNDDSAVINEKPRYMAKLDGEGNFQFRNLPPKTYSIYALKDDGGTKRYLNSKQQFAFADKPVTPQIKSDSIILYAFSIKAETTATSTTPVTTQGPRNKIQGNNANEKRLKYQTNLTNNSQDLQNDLIITFEQPLKQFDSSRIQFFTDTLFNIVTTYKIQKDSNNLIFHLVNEWKENTLYHLVLDKNFAEDSSGKKLLKTDTLTFKTKKLSDYGSLKLKIRNLDIARNPVLIFVTGEVIYKSFPMKSIDFFQPMFAPGDYEIRILFDDNKNGKWDPGQFFSKHKQPEIVKPIERKITVKPGWQNEFEIQSPL